MGAIRLATSNSTDEEYGGTFPLDASDIPYDANTTVKQKIDDVASGLVKTATTTFTFTANIDNVITFDIRSLGLTYNPTIIGVSFTQSEVNTQNVFSWYQRNVSPTTLIVGVRLSYTGTLAVRVHFI